jgi:hypothetical protein
MKTARRAAALFISAGLLCTSQCVAQSAPNRDQFGEKFDSPGAKLTYKETARQFMGDRTVVTYNLFATGLSADGQYVLWSLGLGSNPQPVADAYLNKDGKVVNVLADPQRHISEDPIDLKLFGSKGELFRFAVISADGSLRAFTQIVPFPMEKASGPCHLSAIEIAPSYAGVLIVVTGLQPNEALTTDQQSENEGGEGKGTANAEGIYNAAVLPFVKAKKSGKARFNVTAQSCKVGIEFSWGEGSQKFQ